MTALDIAREYARRGWHVIPIPPGEKGPRLHGWQNLEIAPPKLAQYFERDSNVGVRLEGGLVDIDLDCPEAIALADLYLPNTKAEFGRPAKPRSHRLFHAVGATFEAFKDPTLDGKNTLLEIRAGGGHQTLFPPSIADGECREWHGEIIAPRTILADSLRLGAAWLAIGCLVYRYVSEHAAQNPDKGMPRLLWEFAHALGREAYRWIGADPPDAPREYPRPRRALSQAKFDLAELVAAIPNNCDWHEWNRIGMAIWAATGGSRQGGVIFDDFSAKSAKYSPCKTAARWERYSRSPPNRLGAGTLVFLARQHGWEGGQQ
jgi:hypothetical protein